MLFRWNVFRILLNRQIWLDYPLGRRLTFKYPWFFSMISFPTFGGDPFAESFMSEKSISNTLTGLSCTANEAAARSSMIHECTRMEMAVPR